MSSPHYPPTRTDAYDNMSLDYPQGDSGASQIQQHPMKLKVLYTFDKDFQATCLARWPEILNVRTLTTEEGVRIGVVGLHTCIQAVISSSPEIVGKEKNDFMVYAFDYSEEDTPLVGQGKISAILSASSIGSSHQDPDEPTIVTGRVAMNKLSVFSKASTEILEVKLRLVPIPSSTQGEIAKPVLARGTLRRTMSANINTGYRHSSPPIPTFNFEDREQNSYALTNQYFPAASSPYSQPSHDFQSADTHFNTTDSLQASSMHNTPGWGDGQSPMTVNGAVELRGSSRPGSRNSQRASAFLTLKSAPATQPVFSPESDYLGEASDSGRARKRAKIMPTQWSNDELFGLNQERLRISASEAASVRDLRRIPFQAQVMPSNLASQDEPGRPPTPRPHQSSSARSPLVAPRQSRLRQMSSQDLPTESDNDADFSDIWQSIESRGPSPRYHDMHSAPTTPLDLPSSPAIRGNDSAWATSPLQPEHPQSMGDLTGNGSSSLRDADQQFDVSSASQLPEHVNQDRSSTQAATQNTSSKAASESLTNYASRGRHIAPLPPNEQRATQKPQPAKASAAPRRPRSSSAAELPRKYAAEKAARRKQLIKERLVVAIGSGEVPEYCSHCGSIETPSWRKAWIKEVSEVNYRIESLEQIKDPPIYEEVMDPATDQPQGTKVILKALPHKTWTEPGFEEVMLCNPCGIYLHKHRMMRPGHCWSKSVEAKPRRISKPDGSRRSSISTRPQDRTKPIIAKQNSTALSKADTEPSVVEGVIAPSSPHTPADDMTQLEQALARMESPRPRRAMKEDEPQLLSLDQAEQLEGSAASDDRRKDDTHPSGIKQASGSVQSQLTPDNGENLDLPIPRPRTPGAEEPSFVPIFRTPKKPTPKKDNLTPTPFRGLFSPAMKTILFPTTPKSRPLVGDDQKQGDETPFTKQLNQYLSEIGYSPNNPQPLDNLPGNAFGADSELFSLPGYDAFNGSQADLSMTDFNMPSSPPLPRSMIASSWDNLFEDEEDQSMQAERERQSSPTPRGKRTWPDAFDGVSDGEEPSGERVYPNIQETLLHEGQKRGRMDGAISGIEKAGGQTTVAV